MVSYAFYDGKMLVALSKMWFDSIGMTIPSQGLPKSKIDLDVLSEIIRYGFTYQFYHQCAVQNTTDGEQVLYTKCHDLYELMRKKVVEAHLTAIQGMLQTGVSTTLWMRSSMSTWALA